jgi:hypothetical protein
MCGGQYAQEPPPCHEHLRRGLVWVLEHPRRHSRLRWAASRRRAAGLHQPEQLWPPTAASWSPKVSPSAGIPSRRVGRVCIGTTLPPGTERGPGRPVGEAWRWLRRRTENPWGFSPCGVSIYSARQLGSTCRTPGQTAYKLSTRKESPLQVRRLLPQLLTAHGTSCRLVFSNARAYHGLVGLSGRALGDVSAPVRAASMPASTGTPHPLARPHRARAWERVVRTS